MNSALSHIPDATIQTAALINIPLLVIVGWGLGKTMNLNIGLFEITVMIMAIIVIGNFLHDQKRGTLRYLIRHHRCRCLLPSRYIACSRRE